MAYSAELTQQNGFVHAGIITAGLDNACGIAAFTLMPKDTEILTVEFKTNLLAPAKGERFCRASGPRDPGCDHDRHIDGACTARLRFAFRRGRR